MKKKMVINYDTYDYDYSTYWKSRDYENIAEHSVLNRLVQEKGDWFVDIGGSYGRLTDTYYKSYKKSVLLDYSYKTLVKNRGKIVERFPNTELIAANAYKMPFKESVFDGGLMVRVLHHIERQEEYYKELKRILRHDSIYIQEFANKMNIKARIRALLKLDLKYFSTQPYQQPTINLEGAKNPGVTFLNYHPKYIRNLFLSENFTIVDKQGCSYLRSPKLKKMLGVDSLVKIENVLQKILKTTNIPPSIFFKTKLYKQMTGNRYSKLEDILCCPSCHKNLKITDNKATCEGCNSKYFKEKGVWDFRIE
jgi:ubiquinone/menaquinone biosynthesis C-methylase UbiE